jgi:uncharacterized protein
MKYIDGKRFRMAVIAAANKLISNEDYLNRINVFPVPDGDTGTNMAATLHAIVVALQAEDELGIDAVSQKVSIEALENARGNSGVILAQFFYGLAEELGKKKSVSTREFAEAVQSARRYAYSAMADPREGTILSVITMMSNTWSEMSAREDDFEIILRQCIGNCQKELADSPNKLQVLKDAAVVDAGAQGFVNMLEGVLEFMGKGRLDELIDTFRKLVNHREEKEGPVVFNPDLKYRYCTECLVEGSDFNREIIGKELHALGDSIILAGTPTKLKLHIHTNEPEAVFELMGKYGNVRNQKADDMKKQSESAAQENKNRIAVVVDSIADLSEEYLSKYDIHVVPIRVAFGNDQYIDKITLDTRTFYEKLRSSPVFPKTSQPSPKDFTNMYRHLLSHYGEIISVHVSKNLSGTYQAALNAAKQVDPDRIHVVDSKSGGLALGIIAIRAVEKLNAGGSVTDALKEIYALSENRSIFILFETLEYIVKGGRLNANVGKILTKFKIMPLITYDDEGRLGKAGIVRPGEKAWPVVLKKWRKSFGENLTDIGIMHANDPQKAARLQLYLEKEFPQARYFISEIGPGVGSYSGPGTLGVVAFSK